MEKLMFLKMNQVMIQMQQYLVKSDMTIIGSGKLTVNANYNNGIASNDDLKIQSGNIFIVKC